MINLIRQQLSQTLPSDIVDKLLETYIELKHSYYLGKHRPGELEGGRFSEVVFRILEHVTKTPYTPLGQRIDTEAQVKRLANLSPSQYHNSIRIHIPRALRVIYDIRNRRDVGHVGGDVSPNLADATLVITVCDWILSELLRLYYGCPLQEAQILVDSIVQRKVPLVQDFNGFLKVLDPRLDIKDKILVLLYVRGKSGATIDALSTWLKVTKSKVTNNLTVMENKEARVHKAGACCFITNSGIKHVEENITLCI